MPSPDQWDIAIVVAVLCAAAAVQTLTGAGFGLTAAPPLLVAAPVLVPDTLLWLTVIVTGCTVWAERSYVDWVFVRRATLAAIPGMVAGAAATSWLPGSALALGIAVSVVAAGCAGLCGLRLPLTRASTATAGFLSGALNWAAALPGPPVALVYQCGHGPTFRATLSLVFLLISAATLVLRYGCGAADGTDLLHAAALTVAVASGVVLARPLARRVPQSAVSTAALALSTASGVVLLIRTLR